MPKVTTEQVVQTYQDNGGNVQATAKELKVGRASIYHHLKKAGVDRTKKLADGNVTGIEAVHRDLPKGDGVRRYILTSAQNNTHVHEPAWNGLLALAEHYDAEIMIGTFTYNHAAYGPASVKKGTCKRSESKELWYDPKIKPYIVDNRHQLANHLFWCGEMNILPTAIRPLTGFDSYTGCDSAVFPHAKLAMESIATGFKDNTKFNYTTGTVTQRNYLQKKEGLKAEFHHCYGGVLVEVDSEGNWWLRQLNSTKEGTIYDLDVVVEDGVVYENDRIEAVTWGDTHALLLDKDVEGCSHRMLDELRPKYQFIHDLMAGSVTNHWSRKSLHTRFKNFIRSGAWSDLKKEFQGCNEHLEHIYRDFCTTYIVDANHDRPWIERWLDSREGLDDPKNALLWLKLNAAMYEAMEKDPYGRHFHILEYACHMLGLDKKVATFLREDQSLLITKAKIECGMHGHLGPNGARGNPNNLSRMGRKANIGHMHKAGIHDGIYVAGVSCEVASDAWYARGPSSWSHSHILTYPNGKRTIITVWKGKYRA